MTYRRDSDIHLPYGIIKPKVTRYKQITRTEFNKKTKTIIYLVNNCKSIAPRIQELLRSIEQYIRIDKVESCGAKCNDKCFKFIESKYKFYLAFEDSMCVDFVKEVYKPLKYNIIPVVLGNSDYNKSVPPNSVVNFQSFESTKDFASFIKDLSGDFEGYKRYFEWKSNFVVENAKEYALCQLCDMLHKPLEKSCYGNIENWFYGKECYP